MNLENGPAFLPSRFYADNSSLFSHIFWGRGVDENICAFPFFAPPFYVFLGGRYYCCIIIMFGREPLNSLD